MCSREPYPAQTVRIEENVATVHTNVPGDTSKSIDENMDKLGQQLKKVPTLAH